MGEESTQLDLSSELDRLAAMKETNEDGGGPRVRIGETVIEPERIEDHRLVGLTVETDDPDLRGTRWHQPLQDLRRDGVTFELDGEPVDAEQVFTAVGGADLSAGYVLDRATFVVFAITGRTDDTVELRVIDAPPEADATTDDEHEVAVERLASASRPGFADGQRYAAFDALGGALDPAEIDP